VSLGRKLDRSRVPTLFSRSQRKKMGEDHRSDSDQTTHRPPYRFSLLGPLASEPALAYSVSALPHAPAPIWAGPVRCSLGLLRSGP
jgi:hypothetical protein